MGALNKFDDLKNKFYLNYFRMLVKISLLNNVRIFY